MFNIQFNLIFLVCIRSRKKVRYYIKTLIAGLKKINAVFKIFNFFKQKRASFPVMLFSKSRKSFYFYLYAGAAFFFFFFAFLKASNFFNIQETNLLGLFLSYIGRPKMFHMKARSALLSEKENDKNIKREFKVQLSDINHA